MATQGKAGEKQAPSVGLRQAVNSKECVSSQQVVRNTLTVATAIVYTNISQTTILRVELPGDMPVGGFHPLKIRR